MRLLGINLRDRIIDMIKVIPATINDKGQIKLQKPLLKANPGQRLNAMVIITENQTENNQELISSEPAFAREWDRPEEDAAWQKLDQALL